MYQGNVVAANQTSCLDQKDLIGPYKSRNSSGSVKSSDAYVTCEDEKGVPVFTCKTAPQGEALSNGCCGDYSPDDKMTRQVLSAKDAKLLGMNNVLVVDNTGNNISCVEPNSPSPSPPSPDPKHIFGPTDIIRLVGNGGWQDINVTDLVRSGTRLPQDQNNPSYTSYCINLNQIRNYFFKCGLGNNSCCLTGVWIIPKGIKIKGRNYEMSSSNMWDDNHGCTKPDNFCEFCNWSQEWTSDLSQFAPDKQLQMLPSGGIGSLKSVDTVNDWSYSACGIMITYDSAKYTVTP